MGSPPIQLPIVARAGLRRALAARGARRRHGPDVARPARRRGADTAGRIADELEALERRLLAAGLGVDGVLSPAALAAVIRSSSRYRTRPMVSLDGWPWPLAVEESWSSIRTDATWHAVSDRIAESAVCRGGERLSTRPSC